MEEIEYKYLVDKVKWNAVNKPKGELIVQGFLHNTKACVVRIRIKGSKGFLTIKGETKGITRKEFEYEIPVNEAQEIVDSFISKSIRKIRYEIPFGTHTWEVDVFEGALDGLIIAELEVTSEAEKFETPDWVTEDVSHDPSYYNAVLIEKC
jgi:adenylate cyclase